MTMQYPTIGPHNGSNFIGLTYTMSFPTVGPNVGPNFPRPNYSPTRSTNIVFTLVTPIVSSPLENFEKLVHLPILFINTTQPSQEVKWSHDSIIKSLSL